MGKSKYTPEYFAKLQEGLIRIELNAELIEYSNNPISGRNRYFYYVTPELAKLLVEWQKTKES